MTSFSAGALRKQSWAVGLAGVIATAAFGIGHSERFFQSYLFAYEYVAAVSFGALGFLLLYLLVGGKWGRPIRSILAASASTIPWISLLFIPVLVGFRSIYPWAPIAAQNPQALGAHKAWFFQVPFFMGRSVFYLIVFNVLALWAKRKLRYELRTGHPQEGSRRAGAVGFLVFFVTMSFASFDWTMSLEPHWFSSVYGALVISGYGLSGLAFCIIILNWLTHRYPDRFSIEPKASLDLGNLLLAVTLFWTYMSLSQYIIIWSGNLPEEISWYVARRDGGWRYLAGLLFCGQFFYSFVILLGMERKRVLHRLTRVAFWVLAIRLLEAFWMVTPDYHPGQIVFHWTDLALLVALGGLWSGAFFGRLSKEVAL